MNRSHLHNYQLHAEQHILSQPAAGLFLEMGLGKSVVTLSAIDELMYNRFEVSRVLVIAPLRVAGHTWTTEASKWEHLRHLRVSRVLGTEAQRLSALAAEADIWVINRENVVWLVEHYAKRWPFDMVVIDELSSFKNHAAKRFRALRKIRPKVKRIVGLTGTPAPNGLLDLWPQVYLLDQGQRLEQRFTGYRERYFQPASYMGQVVTKYELRTGCDQAIHEKIRDIVISMKAEDYLDLPERMDLTEEVILPPKVMQAYHKFEEEMVLRIMEEIDSASDINAVNAADLTSKLLQFTGGAVYHPEGSTYQMVHEAKLEALEALVEAAVAEPVLVFYNFIHEKDRILERLKGYGAIKLGGPEHVDKWNRGEIPVLVCHPASAGHGLNLQEGGRRIIWYGLPWSLELYQQSVARLHRQGQSKPVMNHILICPGTIETDVAAALTRKAKMQDVLMAAVKARIVQYITRKPLPR